MKKILLSKTFSREHSLFYCCMWRDCDEKELVNALGFNVRNMLFMRENSTNKISAWYDLREIERMREMVSRLINTDTQYFDKVKQGFKASWDWLFPYLSRKKNLETINDLKKFYQQLAKFWSLMTAIMCIPDAKNIPKNIVKEAVGIREETQAYSDQSDKVFLDFFRRKYPQYFDIAFVMLPSEIFQLEKKPLTTKQIETIQKRLKGYCLLNDDLFLLPELRKKLDQQNSVLEQLSVQKKVIEIKGVTASKGTATGKVRIILYKTQLSEFKKGEILITEMTSQDFVPAMKRASAIVTDEGGITCHAAIISRELKKPCIIGTKIATKVFNDGDLVEVDATKGVVNKIK